MTKIAIFENSRWRTAAILKIALSPYLSRELSDFDQIWYADVHFNSHDEHLTKNRNFPNSRWRTDVFGYISAPYWPINAKIGTEMKDHMPIYRARYQNCNFRKFKMADGRQFENSFISISQP